MYLCEEYLNEKYQQSYQQILVGRRYQTAQFIQNQNEVHK